MNKLTAIIFILFSKSSFSQMAFEKQINISSQTIAGRAIETSDNSIFYCGSYYDSVGSEGSHLVLGKLDYNGNELWQNFLVSGEDVSCWGLRELPNGDFVIGYNKDNHMRLLKVNITGDSLLDVVVAPIGGGNNVSFAEGYSLTSNEQGTILFSGFEWGTNPLGYPYSGANYARYDSFFHLVAYWVPSSFVCANPNVYSTPSEVKSINEKFYYAINLQGNGCPPQSNLGLMNYSGDSVWIRNLWQRSATSININEIGDCFISSSNYSNSSYISMYDSSGNLLWETETDFSPNILLAASADRGAVATLKSNQFQRYDSLGNKLWSFKIGEQFYNFDIRGFERCFDESYLGTATVQDSLGLSYSLYIFRTVTDNLLNAESMKANEQSFMCFPNPAIESVTIKFNQIPINKKFKISITDLSGNIFVENYFDNNPTIDIRSLSAGAYIIRITTQSKISETKLLVKINE